MGLLEDAQEAREKFVKDMEEENQKRESAIRAVMMQKLKTLVAKVFPDHAYEFEYFNNDPDFGRPYAQVGDIRFMDCNNHGWINVLFPCDTCEEHWTLIDNCYDLVSFGRILEMPFKKCNICLGKEEDEERLSAESNDD